MEASKIEERIMERHREAFGESFEMDRELLEELGEVLWVAGREYGAVDRFITLLIERHKEAIRTGMCINDI